MASSTPTFEPLGATLRQPDFCTCTFYVVAGPYSAPRCCAGKASGADVIMIQNAQATQTQTLTSACMRTPLI